MASAHHSRKPSGRASLPRRTTKGPLDAVDDPSLASSRHSPLPQPPQDEASGSTAQQSANPQPSIQHAQQPSVQVGEPIKEERELSFLFDTSIYHPLSQLEVPGPFRKPFLPPPTNETSVARSLEQLDALLSQCEFLRAAHLAGSILTSGTVRPTDSKTVFRLLAVRYSCLELSGNLLLAAQEAKALEDLSSAFYYDDPNVDKAEDDEVLQPHRVPHHIMPFSLRLQALRLQSIGFSDPRRGVSTLYDTAFECREHLSTPSTTPEQRVLWTERLHEVSIWVVNALIEMGDLDCAARTLETIKPGNSEHRALWTSRMILVRIKMGDMAKAHKLMKDSEFTPEDKLALESLLAVADGRYKEASEALSKSEAKADPSMTALVKQNLAVAYLYQGEVPKAKSLLEELINDGHSFQTLTINLATIYDLTSDRSRDLKMSMISQIAGLQKDQGQSRAFVNADFKM
ncbi:uncharacterized protein Z518_11336 [Rhinocladiella mackenziei CBS 650.93]|uniref:Tetratricopeptide repeat protein 15 n=1 Tax=Rhinocladiella mackenziei CBS 650.93 TaxID=1442369 RepID=A0A0D2I0U3_9EURO|nr:uncharacterized protein Z518_11336 [Rhinocladiella mackenziei CBS 650.93]KIW99348.1 hypothetical protein Z518_11336 [Rhinocladiella mackenziei CBS 650.93]